MNARTFFGAACLLSLTTLAGCIVHIGGSSGYYRPYRSQRTPLRGNGVEAYQIREEGEFHSVRVSHALDARIGIGGEWRVMVSGDENLLDVVRTRVRGNTLEVDTDGAHDLETELPLVIEIQMPELRALDLSGASSADVAGLDASTLALSLSAATRVRAQGKAQKLRAKGSGASVLELGELRVERAEIRLSGASCARVYCSETARAELSGASTLVLRGPAALDLDASGVSRVRREDG